MQLFDFMNRGNAARRDQMLTGRVAQFADGVEGQPEHEALRINVRVEKCGAVRVESPNHFQRSDVRDFLPAANCNFAALGINGKNELFWMEFVRELLREASVDCTVMNQRRTDDDSLRSVCECCACSVE